VSVDLLDDLRTSLGATALQLAWHAALPVVVDPGLLSLLRVNFFLDPPKVLPFDIEAELLLSPLFREVGEGLYEIDTDLRNEFLTSLYRDFGVGRVRRVASLLEQYADASAAWRGRPSLDAAQRLTALSVLDPAAADAWLEENGLRPGGSARRLGEAWQVAMRRRVTEQRAAAAVGEAPPAESETAEAEPAASEVSGPDAGGISYAAEQITPSPVQLVPWHVTMSGGVLSLTGPCPACAHETGTTLYGVSAPEQTGQTGAHFTASLACSCAHLHAGRPAYVTGGCGRYWIIDVTTEAGAVSLEPAGSASSEKSPAEQLARSIHSAYVAMETDKGETPATNPSMVPWERLPENLRQSNVAQAADIGAKMEEIGAIVVPESASAPAFDFTAEEIEHLAQLEHQRWMREKLDAGWKPGPLRDDARKIHPDLQEWNELSEADKDKDRNAIRSLPATLRNAGYQIRRLRPRPY
jgi:RyR domain